MKLAWIWWESIRSGYCLKPLPL